MRKQPEPLEELLYQEFPHTDPVEIERMIKTVEKWLQQRFKEYTRRTKSAGRKLGEDDVAVLVAKVYPRCIEELLRELDPKKHPIHT